MKKFMLMIIAVGALTFTSCSSDDDGGSSSKNCEQLVEDVQSALQNFTTEPSKGNCIAYKKAAKAFLKSSCSGASEYEGQIDQLDCDGMQ